MTRHRRRVLVFFSAQLALFGLVFQIAALDHWTPVRIDQVRGIEHSHLHATHCHGDAAGCAEVGTAPALTSDGPVAIPVAPTSRLATLIEANAALPEAPVDELLHPPRAA